VKLTNHTCIPGRPFKTAIVKIIIKNQKTMKAKLASYALAAILITSRTFGQVAPQSSVQITDNQARSNDIEKVVDEKKNKLAQKQNELERKRADMQKSTERAQASADANTSAAKDLTKNPQDKKLSRKASNTAKEAQRDARIARKDLDSVKELDQEITALQTEIQQKEQELASASTAGAFNSKSPATENPAVSQAGNKDVLSDKKEGALLNRQNQQPDAANPKSPVIVQQNVMPDSNTPGAAAIAKQVLESTYKNYPQQQGQPAIIINNIIVPSEYNNLKSGHGKSDENRIADEDLQDYEDYKAWLKYKRRNETRPSGLMPRETESAQREPGKQQNGMTFKDRFAEKPVRNSGLWVIPMVGIHASNFKADFQDDQYEGRSGWNAGLDFRFRMRKFFIQPGVHFFSSSIDVTREDSISTAPLLSGPRIQSLKAPLMLGVYLTKARGGFFRFNVKGGVVGNYVLNVDRSDADSFDKENIEDFSYGLNAGLGLEFGFVTLDFSHEWGMSPLFKDSNRKNNVLRATLGFKL
jgi:uncharacterized small protein (DUF1192 family)